MASPGAWALAALGVLAICLGGTVCRAAIGDAPFIAHEHLPGSFAVAAEGKAAPLFLDAVDWPGVLRAARDLQAYIERVTGRRPTLELSAKPRGSDVIIVGTVGRSALIDGLAAAGTIDAAAIQGRWEAFLIQTVEHPWPGVDRALVIAGGDKRGTIFGVYTVSEQIGVSPWYWWADVPVVRRDRLVVPAGTRLVEAPVVKYRGIFLNDEEPALGGWVREKFDGFKHRFYAQVFELILRLRGNYLWPAMWEPRAFNDDDPLNPALADEYGVVMSTSHHEPMMRAHNEWRRFGRGPWDYAANDTVLRDYWRGGVARGKDFERVVTLGMRGDGDEAMSEETNVALLERIVDDQREILEEVMGRPAEQVPQVWALYKEVQGYYERGMRVPDDVILLWCDDNWGNIRRLPAPGERNRSGGAGVYYHFDYVGGPRNYKWINTVPIAKVREQMHLAWRHKADRLWIVNVGDLKPMEFPIEFFLTYAWDPARWPHERLGEYSRAWAAREFGAAQAGEIAALVNGYTKLNYRRKPELLSPDTLSLVNYREAGRVLGEWRDLVGRAEAIGEAVSPAGRDAFFQLVLYPVKASANAWELHVAAGLNALHARQGRADAGDHAGRARALFAEDARLAEEYHTLGGGKWNHMMAQVKFGYTYWQQPDIETMPAVSEVRPRAGASLAFALEGSERAWPSYNAGPAILPPLDAHARGTRWIEVFNRGRDPFDFRAAPDQPWVTVSPGEGTVNATIRLEVGVDWDAVPPGATEAVISITGGSAGAGVVRLPVRNPGPLPAGFAGFVESDGHVAIEAVNFSRSISDGGIEWRVLPGFGRAAGGVTTLPVTAAVRNPREGTPRLEYDVCLFSAGEVAVELQFAPSLDFLPGEGLRFGVSVNDEPPQIARLDTWATLQTWEKAVSDGVRRVTSRHVVDRPGPCVLKYWMVTPGLVLERVIIDAGGVRPSYLGPPESPRVGGGATR